ncbi:MAG: hypothetical protein M0R66_10045, partial [Candidatus Omnitrophica bacterium]|nr:hypothetical protein [Candidatus Omnitrophota bacterium]
KSLTEYPDVLKVLVSSYENITGVTAPTDPREKLAAVLSNYKGEVGSVAAILGLAYKRDNMIQVDGRSVYVANGNIQFNSTEARQLTGVDKIQINNFTHQYVPQINHILANFNGQGVGENTNTSSYRASNVSEDVVKFVMRNSSESFSVGSFGAYMKPGDNIFVEKNFLTGIGKDYTGKSMIVLSGSKVILNSRTGFSNIPNEPSKIVFEESALKNIGIEGGYLYKDINNKNGIDQIFYKEWLKGASAFEKLDFFGKEINVAGIETRKDDLNTYAIGDINSAFERKLDLPFENDSSAKRIFLEDQGTKISGFDGRLVMDKGTVIKGYLSSANNEQIAKIKEWEIGYGTEGKKVLPISAKLIAESTKDITFNKVDLPDIIPSIFNNSKHQYLQDATKPREGSTLPIDINVVKVPGVGSEGKQGSRVTVLGNNYREVSGQISNVTDSFADVTINSNQSFPIDIPENAEAINVEKGIAVTPHFDKNIDFVVPPTQANDLAGNHIFAVKDPNDSSTLYYGRSKDGQAWVPGFLDKEGFIPVAEFKDKYGSVGGLNIGGRNYIVRDDKFNYHLVSSGEVEIERGGLVSLFVRDNVRVLINDKNGQLIEKKAYVNPRAIGIENNLIVNGMEWIGKKFAGEGSGKVSANNTKEPKIPKFKEFNFIGKASEAEGESSINEGFFNRGFYRILAGKNGTYYVDVNSYAPLMKELSSKYPELSQDYKIASDNYSYVQSSARKLALLPPAVILTGADFVFFSKGVASSNLWVGAGLLTLSAASSLGAEETFKYAITGEHITFKEGLTNVSISALTGGLGRAGKVLNAAGKVVDTSKTVNLVDAAGKTLANTMEKGGLIAKTNYLIDNTTSIITTGEALDIKDSLGSVAGGYGVYAAFNGAGTLANIEKLGKFSGTSKVILAKGLSGSAYNLAVGAYRGKVNNLEDAALYGLTGFAGGVTSGWLKNPVYFAASSNFVGSVTRELSKKAQERNVNNVIIDSALGVLSGSVWAQRSNIGKFLDGQASVLYKQAKIIGVGGLTLGVGRDLLNNQLNYQSSLGQFATSFTKGALTAEILSYGFRKNGLQYHLNSQDGLLVRLAKFSDAGFTQRKMLVGAAEWPVVTFTMGMAQPVWNYGFDWLDYSLTGNKVPVAQFDFRSLSQWLNHAGTVIAARDNDGRFAMLDSFKHGLYMGPA